MARLNPRQVTEQVTVQPVDGSAAWGDLAGTSVSTRVAVDATRRLVRDRNGTEVVSEMRLLVSPAIAYRDLGLAGFLGDLEDLFAAGGLVARAGHRSSQIISCRPIVRRGRMAYLEVNLS